MKYFIGFVSICILSFPLIEYGVTRFVPDPLEAREKEVIKQFKFMMSDGGRTKTQLKNEGYEFPEGVIPEIVSMELKKVIYWPSTYSFFTVTYRLDETETRDIKYLGAMNRDHLLVGAWHRWFWNIKEY